MTATGTDRVLGRVAPTRQHRLEVGAAVVAATLAIGSVWIPHWTYRYDPPLIESGPDYVWLVAWFWGVVATSVIVVSATLTALLTRPEERSMWLTALAALGLGASLFELWTIHDAVRSMYPADGYHGGWGAPGAGSRWLAAAGTILLTSRLRPTRWSVARLRPSIGRWLARWR